MKLHKATNTPHKKIFFSDDKLTITTQLNSKGRFKLFGILINKGKFKLELEVEVKKDVTAAWKKIEAFANKHL